MRIYTKLERMREEKQTEIFGFQGILHFYILNKVYTLYIVYVVFSV